MRVHNKLSWKYNFSQSKFVNQTCFLSEIFWELSYFHFAFAVLVKTFARILVQTHRRIKRRSFESQHKIFIFSSLNVIGLVQGKLKTSSARIVNSILSEIVQSRSRAWKLYSDESFNQMQEQEQTSKVEKFSDFTVFAFTIWWLECFLLYCW